MQKSKIENRKQRFIKHLSMLLLVFYVLNLLQFQISPVLHSISHILEAPKNMMSHHSIAASKYEIHNHGDHYAMQNTHEHEIIDLLDSILEPSKGDNNTDETILLELKFDKHLNVEKYQKKVALETKKSKPFLEGPQKSKRGHFEILQEPPQLS